MEEVALLVELGSALRQFEGLAALLAEQRGRFPRGWEDAVL